MSDQTPMPAEDGWTEVQPDITEQQQIIADDVQEARKAFTLVDMFAGTQGILPTKKRMIFRDLDAANEYEAVHAEAERLRGILALEPEGKMTAAEKKERAEAVVVLEEALAKVEPKEADAKERMLATAVVFHLRAYPNVAIKVAKREARKIFIDPTTKTYREDVDREEADEWLQERLFGELVQRVTDSTGQEIDFGVPKAELGSMLSSGQRMHPVHWQLLKQDQEELSIRAGIVQGSLEDAGF